MSNLRATHYPHWALALALSLSSYGLGATPLADEPLADNVEAASPLTDAEAAAAEAEQAQSIPEPAAIFKKVKGSVLVYDAAGKQRRVQPGDALQANERVHSSKAAGTSITLGDGTQIMLDERSAFQLSAYNYDSTTHEGNMLLRFIGGKLRFISGLMSKAKPDSVKIQAPTAVIGVRGTDFILEAKHVD